jgi:hypothetical protein
MKRVSFIAFPDFQVLGLSSLSVFECANMLANEPVYDLRILSEAGGPIQTSSGLTLETERFDESKYGTLIVLGTLVARPTFSAGLLAYVGDAPRKARRLASFCTGALVLAEAGLLDVRCVRSDIALADTHARATPKRTQHKELVVPTLAGEWNDHNARASILRGFSRNAQGPRSFGQHWRCELVV